MDRDWAREHHALSITQIPEIDYGIFELRRVGVPAETLRRSGFEAEELRKGGYTVDELRKAGYTDMGTQYAPPAIR